MLSKQIDKLRDIMGNQSLAVDMLRKISLSIEAGTSSGTMDLTKKPFEMDFIFGIGSNGLTPFEYELADKHQGHVFEVRVPRRSASIFFEHLAFSILKNIEFQDDFFLKASILNISTPESREIIKAMATKSGCGDDCNCGCGCH